MIKLHVFIQQLRGGSGVDDDCLFGDHGHFGLVHRGTLLLFLHLAVVDTAEVARTGGCRSLGNGLSCVVWCGVVWCSVVLCGVVWCDVVWCDVV